MKKLLSLLLVVAMLLGMTAMPVFAADATALTISGSSYVATGKTVSLSVTPNGDVNSANTYTWTVQTGGDKAEVSSNGTVTGKAAGDATIKCVSSNPDLNATHNIEVLDATKLSFTRGTSETRAQSVAVDGTLTLKPVAKYNDSTSKITSSSATVSATSSDTSVATVSYSTPNGNLVVTGLKKGEATITANISFAGWTASCEYVVTVEGFELTNSVENGDELYYDDDDLCKALADAITSDIDDADVDYDEITSVKFDLRGSTDYGDLYVGATDSKLTSSVNVYDDGITFEAAKGSLGDMVYDVTVVDEDSHTYKGTWTFTVAPVEEIDEEVTAQFARMSFYLDFPKGIDYLKEVADADHFSGSYTKTTSGMKEDDEFVIDPTALTLKNGKATLYVVGLDDDGYAYSGTIEIYGADADFVYAGTEDKETSVVAKDFVDLFEDIADEKGDDDSTYDVELDSVKFELGSSSKGYNIYYDGTKMTSKTQKVDVDDLGKVTIEPTSSKKVIVDFTMYGTKTNTKTNKDSSLTYYGSLAINAVAGDVKYSVITKGSVYLDEDDFQDFFEDAVDSATAVLNYIVIDDSDLKSTQGVFQLPYSSTKTTLYSAIEEGEKLYTEDKAGKNDYEIGEARFTAASTVANGSKIYVPFTATGKKGSSTKTAEGYIEITVINNPFTDLKQAWYKDAVLWAYSHNPQITKGTNVAGTLFSPDLGCTRAQAVTFLYRAAGAPSITASARTSVLATFKDLDATKHKDYIDAIAWAKANGITSGTSTTTFGPDKTCTRAQIVTFIYNYAKAYGKDTTVQYTNAFTDVKPTTTHKSYANAIQWAYEHKITSGTSATTFAPDATCTRGHIVTFLYNYFN